MAIKTEKSVFYHIPKTGGIGTKEAIRRVGMPYGRCRENGDFGEWGMRREHSTFRSVIPEHKDGRYSFAFVRHPIGWYKSFWCYRAKTGHLDLKFPPDRVWDDDYERFINNMVSKYPYGFLGKLYQFFVGTNANRLDFIGKQENLEDDLVQALNNAGEEYDETHLRRVLSKNFNLSGRAKKYRDACQLSGTATDRLLEAESWVVETFYDS
jgi:hypothetical protein